MLAALCPRCGMAVIHNSGGVQCRSLQSRQKAFATVKGRRMAYIEADTGNAIVFQHGNPTSSYLWRNIMPHCEGLGRLIACDLIGMGDSDKLENSGADRYTYVDHRD